MKIKVTEGEYKILRGALRRCDAGNDSFATDCYLLGLKLMKTRNYSKSNIKRPRGVLHRETVVPKKEKKERAEQREKKRQECAKIPTPISEAFAKVILFNNNRKEFPKRK